MRDGDAVSLCCNAVEVDCRTCADTGTVTLTDREPFPCPHCHPEAHPEGFPGVRGPLGGWLIEPTGS